MRMATNRRQPAAPRVLAPRKRVTDFAMAERATRPGKPRLRPDDDVSDSFHLLHPAERQRQATAHSRLRDGADGALRNHRPTLSGKVGRRFGSSKFSAVPLRSLMGFQNFPGRLGFRVGTSIGKDMSVPAKKNAATEKTQPDAARQPAKPTLSGRPQQPCEPSEWW